MNVPRHWNLISTDQPSRVPQNPKSIIHLREKRIQADTSVPPRQLRATSNKVPCSALQTILNKSSLLVQVQTHHHIPHSTFRILLYGNAVPINFDEAHRVP